MSDTDRTGEESAALILSDLYGDTLDGFTPAAYETAYRSLYAQAYQDMCEAVTGDRPLADPPDEEWFKERVLEFLEARRDDLEWAICERLKYCDNKHFFGATVKLIIFLAQALIGLWDWKLAPACWLVLSGLLDKFCNCGTEAEVRVRRIAVRV